MKELKRIDAISLGYYFGSVSMIFCLIVFIMTLITGSPEFSLIFQPIAAFFGGLIGAGIYNFVAKTFGGVKIQLG